MPGLSTEQRVETADVAELVVRRYFDHYLDKTFPVAAAAVVAAHDNNPAAHGGVLAQVTRAKYLLIGFAAAGGFGGGVTFAKLVHLF